MRSSTSRLSYDSSQERSVCVCVGGYSLLNTGVSFAFHLLILSLHGYSCFSQKREQICYDFCSLYWIFKKVFTKEPSTVPDTHGIAQEMGIHGCVCVLLFVFKSSVHEWRKTNKQVWEQVNINLREQHVSITISPWELTTHTLKGLWSDPHCPSKLFPLLFLLPQSNYNHLIRHILDLSS